MGAVHARIEPLATEQQIQYERMMSQWVSLYRHLISQRMLTLERAAPGSNLIERQQLARLSALVDEMQASLQNSDRLKTEQLNNQLLDAIRSYDFAPPIPQQSTAIVSTKAGGRTIFYTRPKFWYQIKGPGWTYHF